MRRATFGMIMALSIALVRLQPGYAQRATTAPPRPINDPAAYAVYASLVPTTWPVTAAHAKALVFQQETGTKWPCMPTGQPIDEDWRTVVDNYKSENVEVRTITAGFPMTPPYIVASTAEIRASFAEAPADPMFGWTGFYRRYPDSGGLIRVSAVGFNASKTRAMVTMAHSCGAICGGGAHSTLEKTGGVWRPTRVPGLVNNCTWSS